MWTRIIIIVIIIIVVVVVVVDDNTYYWVYLSSTIHFKFITKCDKCYYKVRQVLQSETILLQSATVDY